MKKPALIVLCILGILGIAVAIAVIVDMSQRNENSNPAPQPVVQAPVQQQPVAQLQNLQMPVPGPAEDARVAELIRSLSDPNFNLSIQAEKELLLIGKPALPQLETAAATAPDEQTRTISKRLIAHINSGTGLPPVAQGGNDGLAALQGRLAMGGRGGRGDAIPEAGRRRRGGRGGWGGGGGMGLLALLGGMGGRRGHGFDVPNPRDVGVGDLSTNLMDSFGARLSEAADGVRVLDVKQGTSASSAGLKVGDLITIMNGRQVVKGEDIKEIYGNLATGDKIEIEVTRGGDSVTLAAKK